MPQEKCCKHTLETSKSVCSHLGIKIKTEKCVGPTTRITFLGIEIDTLSQTMRVPKEKLCELLMETSALIKRKKCKKREISVGGTSKVYPKRKNYFVNVSY